MDKLRNMHTLFPERIHLETYGPGEIHLVHVLTLLLPVSYFLFVLTQRQRTVKAPLVASEFGEGTRKKKFIREGSSVLKEGYAKVKAGLKMYRITTSDGSEVVILGHKYAKELRELPDDTLDAIKAAHITLVGDYSTLGQPINHTVAQSLRSQVTPILPRLASRMADETDFAIQSFFPKIEDWTAVKIKDLMMKVTPQVSARIFVGEKVCRDLRWNKLSMEYTSLAFIVPQVIRPWHPLLRPIVSHFLPEVRQLRKVFKEATDYLTKLAMERDTEPAEHDLEHDDMIDWLRAKSPRMAKDYAKQAEFQLLLALASIHTSTMTVTQALFDLASYPEVAALLREELEAAMAETGGLNKDTLPKLKKMDSFMKESQRMNPISLTTFLRYVCKDVTLKDGTFLPKGIVIAIDLKGRTTDEAIYENPEKFDAWRFLRLRETSQATNLQFVSVNSDSLVWGQGRHACPGRFFAGQELKIILSKMLLKYDIAATWSQRPQNQHFETMIGADPEGEILLKART